ncbi:Hydra magnipapillata [Nesidiocoris tenuis]|uniref:Hydra magnipapillata n=1 Tax=Nesidiocoris tenuis TaxID=355587 RepID=A0ABN7BD61_9HEMI|nr:Hydra magnipapillata [Nesidiocoris tenuis]
MADSVNKIAVLGRDNFDTWRIQIEAVLTKSDLWEYVDGSIVKPTQPEEEIRRWERQDRKARSELILAIKASELKQIKSCKTANELWIKLHSIFASKGPARTASLLKQLTQCRMKIGEDAREFVNNFFDLVDKLHELDIEINDKLLAILLLNSLPEEFENFRCAIESRDELPRTELLRIKILEESDSRIEKQQDGNNALISKHKIQQPKGNKPRKKCTKNTRNS